MGRTRWAVLAFMLLSTSPLASSQTKLNRFEVGEQYSFFSNQYGYEGGQHLLGGRFDVRISRHLWLSSQLEAGLNNYPPPGVSSADGGRAFLGCFGLKAGTQRKRLGVFGELRGGFLSWSDEVRSIEYLAPPQPGVNFVRLHYGRGTEPLLNVGGTVEIYARPKVGFRMSVGASFVFLRSRKLTPLEPAYNGLRSNNVHISTGMFYRF